MEKGTCIITEKETHGYPVREDAVIRSIRRIKQAFGIARGARLIVSPEGFSEYRKKRAKFEKTFVSYLAIAIILVAAFVFLPLLFGGRFSFEALLMSILIGSLILLFSITSYVPAIEGAPEQGEKQEAKNAFPFFGGKKAEEPKAQQTSKKSKKKK